MILFNCLISLAVGLGLITFIVIYVDKKGGERHYLKVPLDDSFNKKTDRIFSLIRKFLYTVIIIFFQVLLFSIFKSVDYRKESLDFVSYINELFTASLGVMTINFAGIFALCSVTEMHNVISDKYTILKNNDLDFINHIILIEFIPIVIIYLLHYLFENPFVQKIGMYIVITDLSIMSILSIIDIVICISFIFMPKYKSLKYLKNLISSINNPKKLVSSETRLINENIDYLINNYFDYSAQFTQYLLKKKLNVENISFKSNFALANTQKLIISFKSFAFTSFFFCMCYILFLANNINNDVSLLLGLILVVSLGFILNMICIYFSKKYRIVMSEMSNRGWSYNIGNKMFFQLLSGNKAAQNWLSSLYCIVAMAEKIAVTQSCDDSMRYFLNELRKKVKEQDQSNITLTNLACILIIYEDIRLNDKSQFLTDNSIFKEFTKDEIKIARNVIFDLERQDLNGQLISPNFDEMFNRIKDKQIIEIK